MADIDMLIERICYELTHKADKTNPKSRISISTDLLNIIKNIYYNRDPTLKSISNIDLASLAIIRLLPVKLQEKLLIKLKKENFNLYKLLKVTLNNSSTNQSKLNNETLTEIEERQEQIITLLMALVNAGSYNLAKDSHLINNQIATGDDLYPALRQDSIKSITDLLILAGNDENKRQKHLTNLS